MKRIKFSVVKCVHTNMSSYLQVYIDTHIHNTYTHTLHTFTCVYFLPYEKIYHDKLFVSLKQCNSSLLRYQYPECLSHAFLKCAQNITSSW